MKKDFKNLIQLVEYFKTEEDCIIYLKSILWKREKFCPYCGCTEIMEFSNVKRNRCKECKKDFSIRVGTIFEDSNISLKKWFMASYLFNAHKKGISSCQLAKDVGCTQKTAWFMLQRLRKASGNNTETELKGTCEVDEAYFGGKSENKHMHERIALKEKDNKIAILGMVAREDKKVKLLKVENTTANTLQKEINNYIKEGSIICTDESKSYYSLSQWKYNHKTINHSKDEYSREENFESRENGRTAFKVHTNTMEGFWGLVKRGIYGIYHWASEKHIQRYLNEFELRYNTRDLKDYERFEYFLSNIKGRLSYKSLIA